MNTHRTEAPETSSNISNTDPINLIDTLQITYIRPTKLKAHPDNPRKHSPKQVKQIAHSIRTFGFKFPVLVDKEKQIIAGHGRMMACKQLGIEQVPTIQVDDLSKEQARALMIADNKLTENSQWDHELLAQNFEILMDTNLDMDFDIEVMGFDYGEMEQLVMTIEESDSAQLDADELRDAQILYQAVSKLGDIWLCVKHRLLCGNALSFGAYEVLLEGRQAALVFADPPYNLPASDIGHVARQLHGDFKQAAGEMSSEQFTGFLGDLFKQLVEVTTEGSIHYICMDCRHIGEMMTAGQAHYSELKNLCVLAKDRAGMGSFYRSQHELVFVFKHGDAKHQNNFALGEHGRYRTNVWNYPSIRMAQNTDETIEGSALALHPTMKPIALVSDALLDCSRRGDLVLDPFLGSGTTLLAAEQTGRIAAGIELEPRYLDVAIRRWQTLTSKPAINAQTGIMFDDIPPYQALSCVNHSKAK